MENKIEEWSNAAFETKETNLDHSEIKPNNSTIKSNNSTTKSNNSTTKSHHSTVKSDNSTVKSNHSSIKSSHSASSSISNLPALTEKNKVEVGDDESQQGTYRLYKSRYYVLALYSLVLFFQCAIWNTWGPISETALAVFPNWTEATIATLANWGPIMFVLSVFPTSWAVDRWGLRPVTVAFTGATALGHVLRCVTVEETLFTVFAHICGIVNGIEATILLAGASLPATWFPAAQRVTATAFSQVMNVMGSGGSFMQPLILHSPGNDTTVEEMTQDLRRLMIIEMIIAVCLFALVVIYFPSAPPSPPSPSSTVQRLGFREGFRSIAKNLRFWQLLFAYAIFTGVSMCWQGVMTFSLLELGIDQDAAVYVGIYNSICTGIVCLLTSTFIDLVYGHLKMALLCLMTFSSFFYIWFMLLTLKVWPATDAQVYITVLGGQAMNFACSPLLFELAVETTYPSPESAVGTIMTLANNFVGAIFLFLFYIPGISDNGDVWMTYLLVATNVGAIIPILFFKEEYKRSRLDRASLDVSS